MQCSLHIHSSLVSVTHADHASSTVYSSTVVQYTIACSSMQCIAVMQLVQLISSAQHSSQLTAHSSVHTTAIYCTTAYTLCYGEPWAGAITYYSSPVEWILLIPPDSRNMGPRQSPRVSGCRKYMSQRLNQDSPEVMNTRAHATHMLTLVIVLLYLSAVS